MLCEKNIGRALRFGNAGWARLAERNSSRTVRFLRGVMMRPFFGVTRAQAFPESRVRARTPPAPGAVIETVKKVTK